jgi:hypothetical protein
MGRSLEEGLNIGHRLMATRNYHKAVQCNRLLAIRFPREPRVYMSLGQSLRLRGDHQRMARAFRRAILLQPDAVELYYNFGNAERSFDHANSAAFIYRRALCLTPGRPEIETALSLAKLQMGEWETAWQLYEKRESCREFTSQIEELGRTIWDGQRIKGHRILLVAEQGAGDAIQFVRYARALAESGMIVFVHCQPALERLFSAVPWIDSVSTKSQPDFDSACLIMSLPHRFGTDPQSIPSDVPYLQPLPSVDNQEVRDMPRIGLVWAGTPRNTRDEWRSCPRDALTPLLEIPSLTFQSLQFGWRPVAEDTAWSTVSPLEDNVTDYADTAEIIAGLDLVISVDTSVAHLAGALGKPVWMLLGRHADWRWLLDRPDTSWYPTMRLFRVGVTDAAGNQVENWDDLVSQVATELRVFSSQATA